MPTIKARKTPKRILSHYSDPISQEPSHLGGHSRKAGDASIEVKNKIIVAIQEATKKYGLSQQDTANLIAIAKIESGFNPDAAARGAGTSASGVFQITDETAKDAMTRLNGKPRGKGIKLGPFNRFDYISNIQYGIAIYWDKKQKANSDDVGDIYKKFHTNSKAYTPLLDSLRKDSQLYQDRLKEGLPIIVSEEAHVGGARVVVIKESDSGRNERFLDQLSGHEMSREELVARIQAGEYPDYKVVLINGLDTPVSKPDGITENNLG